MALSVFVPFVFFVVQFYFFFAASREHNLAVLTSDPTRAITREPLSDFGVSKLRRRRSYESIRMAAAGGKRGSSPRLRGTAS